MSESEQDTYRDFANLQRLILNAKGGIGTSIDPNANRTCGSYFDAAAIVHRELVSDVRSHFPRRRWSPDRR